MTLPLCLPEVLLVIGATAALIHVLSKEPPRWIWALLVILIALELTGHIALLAKALIA
jgi:hypothetical protein